jgi:hypothetical protein
MEPQSLRRPKRQTEMMTRGMIFLRSKGNRAMEIG